jgi:iron-sulfur cluster repair protein YtfE (RIC family)
MKERVAYEDAADVGQKQELAERICRALTVHAQIEEELFYPAVREAIGNDGLMDEALAEHAEAKATIAEIMSMTPADDGYDVAVKQLAGLIDEHVLEEREQIFRQARNAPLDLRGLAVPLQKRKQQLTKKLAAPRPKVAA